MSVRRVLVIGCNGLLGQKVTELFVRGSSYTITLASLEPTALQTFPSVAYVQFDMTSKKEVRQLVYGCEPDVIINCAAMTNVDACEHERELAWKINVGGVENLIEAARRSNAKIVHVSSDYIFDGRSGPYTEEDRPEPLSYYGKTKLAGENALRASGLEYFIARTMVLYGYAPGTKMNFALWLLQNLEKKIAVKVVNDQYGNPTLADDLAYGIMRGVEMGRMGIYNIAGREIVQRHEFATRLARAFGYDPALIVPIKTSTLNQPAARPLKSGFITLKAEVELGIRPSDVDEGIAILKSQLSRSGRRLGDSAPVPGQSGAKHVTGRKK
jgi:dTDP-4-dehydrorhamnose reductase